MYPEEFTSNNDDRGSYPDKIQRYNLPKGLQISLLNNKKEMTP